MSILIPLVKLVCAHICSDFILQTDRINEGKHAGSRKGLLYLSLHSAIHAVVAYIFIAQWNLYVIPVVIFFSHFIIDLVKCRFGESVTVFLLDQMAHLIIILALWLCLFASGTSTSALYTYVNNPNLWVILTAYLLMLKPSSILLSQFLRRWMPQSTNAQSLPNAGKWIGYLERILVMTFILIDSLEGVGFLLAAKSVFRFGELSKAKEIKTTEYVMIGTLSSFALSILIGVLAKFFV